MRINVVVMGAVASILFPDAAVGENVDGVLERLRSGSDDVAILDREPPSSEPLYRGTFFPAKGPMLWIVATRPLGGKSALLQDLLERARCTPIALLGTPDDPRELYKMEFTH